MSRDITPFRSVTQNVARVEQTGAVPSPNQSLLKAVSFVAQAGMDIVKMNEEAKINQNLSQARLDLAELDQQIRVKYQSNPAEGLSQFKKKKADILKGYESQVAPFLGRKWAHDSLTVSTSADLAAQTWANSQSANNAITAINESIKNDRNAALLAGEKFGINPESELDAVLNFQGGLGQLQGFATERLGAETSKSLLGDYQSDWMKSFVSGAAQSNPTAALQLMENPTVKASMEAGDYMDLKNSIETRAMNVNKINAQREVLDVMRDETSILAKSLDRPMAYSELRQAMEQSNVSPAAQNLLLSMNGFAKTGGSALSDDQKFMIRQGIFDRIADVSVSKEASVEELREIRDSIYEGMANKSITQAQGLRLINGLMEPYGETVGEYLKNFETGGFLGFGVTGFKEIDKYYKNNIEFKRTKREGGVPKDMEARNARAKAQLYDSYFDALEEQASRRGVLIADLSRMSDKKAIYAEAYKTAIENYSTDRFPELNLTPVDKRPQSVLTKDGEAVSTGGGGGGKVDIVAPKSEYQRMSNNGVLYDVRPKGDNDSPRQGEEVRMIGGKAVFVRRVDE